MASELIEAMAQAYCTTAMRQGFHVDQDVCAERMQAALQAMIEHGPTDAMVKAAMRGRDGTIPAAVVRDIWRVMNAAAKENPDGK